MKKYLLLLLGALTITACVKQKDFDEYQDHQDLVVKNLQYQINGLTEALAQSTSDLQAAIDATDGNVAANAEAINAANASIAENLELIGQVSSTLSTELSNVYAELEATELELLSLIDEKVAQLEDAIQAGDDALVLELTSSVATLRSEIDAAQAAAEAYADANDANSIFNPSALNESVAGLDTRLETVEVATTSNTININANALAITNISLTPGEKGAPGKDGSSVTVTSIEAGSSVTTVTFSDTSVLTIPHGIDGDPGTNGAPGAPGAPGTPGDSFIADSFTVSSTYADGITTVTVSYDDAILATFTVADGSTGPQGSTGPAGANGLGADGYDVNGLNADGLTAQEVYDNADDDGDGVRNADDQFPGLNDADELAAQEVSAGHLQSFRNFIDTTNPHVEGSVLTQGQIDGYQSYIGTIESNLSGITQFLTEEDLATANVLKANYELLVNSYVPDTVTVMIGFEYRITETAVVATTTPSPGSLPAGTPVLISIGGDYYLHNTFNNGNTELFRSDAASSKGDNLFGTQSLDDTVASLEADYSVFTVTATYNGDELPDGYTLSWAFVNNGVYNVLATGNFVITEIVGGSTLRLSVLDSDGVEKGSRDFSTPTTPVVGTNSAARVAVDL